MDCEGVKEAIRKFDEKHGDCVVLDSWLLYQDGAQRELSPLGVLIDPPADKYECSKLILRFYEAKLELAIEEFNVSKRNYMTYANVSVKEKICGPPPVIKDEAVAQLKLLKEKVKKYRVGLERAKCLLVRNKPDWMRDREHISEMNRRENKEFLDEVQKIEI